MDDSTSSGVPAVPSTQDAGPRARSVRVWPLLGGSTLVAVDNPRVSRALIAVTALELLVALYLGIKLTFFTEIARRDWMWTMPPYGTRFMGTVYLTALVPLISLLLIRRWSPARVVNPMVFVFGLTLLTVSLAYLDRFRPDTLFSTALWFSLYVVMPLVAVIHLWLYRRLAPAPAAPLSAGWKALLLALGAVLGLYGLAQVVAPEPSGAFWPWALDDFHARLYSAVFLAAAAGALVLAGTAPAIELFILGLVYTMLGFLPIAAVLTMDAALGRVDWSLAGPRLWVGTFGALGVAGIALVWHAASLGRTALAGPIVRPGAGKEVNL